MGNSNQKINTFLLFKGQAEEAMKFYTSIFDDSEINHVFHQQDGSVMHAAFTLKGQTFMCTDSNLDHKFTFTPAISLFVTCDTSDEIDRVYAALTQDGSVLMPMDSTPVSEKFAWVQDKYGVSWQLNLAKKM
ncbi:VOC family protein [Paenibacillus mendelii]|uniref:VOC family protein n=1 Tax=Paenibacillus mendelii TaxID=206163 RepID=A0ABV6JLY6_9BACL|nr:VOC family protein [Paenibacillus mendelii]MCQ6560602.1 VOC family protein [Paenibacillus mendelii]